MINPSRTLQIGYGFWSSKVLLTAINFELFTLLSDTNKNAGEIKSALKLQDRGLADFLDALVALKFLYREGEGAAARYSNTQESDTFLNKKRPSYIGGILEMANNRLYASWGHLGRALQTGLPQNEIQNGEQSAYDVLYANEQKLAEFVNAMSGAQRNTFAIFARQFDTTGYQSHCDIGGAAGDLSIQMAIHHPGIQSVSFDLPQVAPIAQRNIEWYKVADRVKVASGDFFTDDLPNADIITMGNILHNWSFERIQVLINKAYEALPKAGAFVVIENVIDDERRENAFGMMMSLNMLLNTTGGFNYTAADFTSWAEEAGFKQIRIMHLTAAASALVAYK
jgi:precorrin-6B methylase 2